MHLRRRAERKSVLKVTIQSCLPLTFYLDIRSKHGVITRGIEDMIVDAKPTFEVYFDATQGGITAVVKANYGSIGITFAERCKR